MIKQTWPPVTPKLTVDAVIRTTEGVVLIKRKNPPIGWALPGGFVDIGETVEEAVIREAREETGLKIHDLWLVGVYSDPRRDPRFHTVSVVFGASAEGSPCGADDAAEAQVFADDKLPGKIVLDHRGIIEDFLHKEGNSRR
ncbi:NUDIX hydrolase [bacterium]|nr:NUDIX hydrolase [bacterium]